MAVDPKVNRERVKAVRTRQAVAVKRLALAYSKLPPSLTTRSYVTHLPTHEVIELAAELVEKLAVSYGTSQAGK